MYLQNVDSVYDLLWTSGPNGPILYGDIFQQQEVENSRYNFEEADTESAAAALRRSRSCSALPWSNKNCLCQLMILCSKPRTTSISSMHAARFRYRSDNAIFCGCARWPAPWPKPTSKAAKRWVSRCLREAVRPEKQA